MTPPRLRDIKRRAARLRTGVHVEAWRFRGKWWGSCSWGDTGSSLQACHPDRDEMQRLLLAKVEKRLSEREGV